MGLWGWIKRTFGDEPASARAKATRGPGKSNAERLAGQRVKNMNWLKKNDAEAYRQAVLRETGVIRDATDPISQLKQLGELQRTARKLGLTGDGDSSGDSIDKLIDAAPKLLTALVPMMMGMQNAGQTPTVADPLQIEAPKRRRPRRRADVEPTDETELVEGAEPDDSAELVEPEERTDDVIITPEMAANFARANMEGKPAREAARFLLSQEQHEAVKGMIGVILATPDASLIATLHAHAASTKQPALINLFAWFEGQPAWTLEIAKYIRTAKRPAAARGKLRAL